MSGGNSSILGGTVGGAASDDPYANIAIDLTKVKSAPLPAKPFEQKTEEEKTKDAEKRGNMKSSLKTTAADHDKASLKTNKGVRFGKSTTYEIKRDEDDEAEGFNNADLGQKGSPRPKDASGREIWEEKDLSDGRDEKEKIKEMLEK